MKKMSRKRKVFIIIGTCASIHIMVVMIIGILFFDFFKRPVILSEIPQEFQVVNDNNFARDKYEHIFDLNENYIAYYTRQWYFSKITVWKNNKIVKVVYNADLGFRLVENKLIYRPYYANFVYSLDLLTGKKSKLFIKPSYAVYKGDLIAFQRPIFSLYPDDDIVRIDLKTGECRTLVSDVNHGFSVVGDTIIFLKDSGLKGDIIGKYSLIDETEELFHVKNISKKPASGEVYWPLRVYGDEIVYAGYDGLQFFNPETDVLRETALFENNSPEVISSAFDDEYVYISAKDYHYDYYFFALPEENELNGLWRFNIQTLEGELVSDAEYSWLGYYGENLVGTIGNELYIIDTETFEATKLIAMK